MEINSETRKLICKTSLSPDEAILLLKRLMRKTDLELIDLVEVNILFDAITNSDQWGNLLVMRRKFLKIRRRE